MNAPKSAIGLSDRTRMWIGALAIVGAVALTWISVASKPGTASSSTRDLSIDAKISCRNFVTDQLKAPASASFQSYSGQSASRRSDGSFVVNGYVDSQNAFSANIRTAYTCGVRESNGDWALVTLTTSP